MAKVTKLGDCCWFVSWSAVRVNGMLEKARFKVGESESSLELEPTNQPVLHAFVKLKMALTGSHQPAKIQAFMNGEVLPMEKLEHGCWKSSALDLLELKRSNIVLLVDFTDLSCFVKRMSRLLEEGHMADVAFVVQGQEIRAHKAIVATSSAVMGAMLEPNKFKEGCSKTVEIVDMEPAVFRQLLHYMYTGTASLNEEKSIIEHLIMAADKYMIDGLKESCEDQIVAKLTVENVIHFLVIAHLHSAAKLLQGSLQFLVKHQMEVRKNPEWKKLHENYQELFFLATERICSQPSCGRCNQEVVSRSELDPFDSYSDY